MRVRYRRALYAALLALGQIVTAAQTPDAQSWARLDAQVAELYSKGDLQQAIQVAQSALRAASTPTESGRSLDRLGFLYHTSGDLPNGEKYLRQSLQTRQAAFGQDSLEVAETANDLAMLLRDLRRMDEARTLAEHALAVRERLLGDGTLPFAESLNT
ncbi:MAG: tetratricopeptide repeat protein, partial [Vicinamibacterales bacterium]